ncbi:Lrp/AsnC ligand binding domain-containing protein [Hellea balneolensis]|uniref:Lrp/AsnC ligand binding domain-containing protein n=1 Tax=Hellea balneolensis TaxID=287478 RepID=UPI000410138C|nr:Lrp/AsnC ligand binding domain-containing protein [Hellea balneolensis]
MRKYEALDSIDRKILREIQQNGRISFIDLAGKVGLSKSPCLKRLRALEKERFIKGYRAELDADKISRGYLVYVQVKLSRTNREALQAFNSAVQDIKEIMCCDMMSGGYDYLLKVRTRNMHTYREFLGDVISVLPGIDQTSSFPVMEQVKEISHLVVE